MVSGQSGEAWRRLDKFCTDKDYFARNTEDKFEDDLRDILGLMQIASIHMKEGGEMPLPDILCFPHKDLNCKFRGFFIETKRKNRYKLSDAQKAAFDLLRDYVHIESVKTWEEAVLFLNSVLPREGGDERLNRDQNDPGPATPDKGAHAVAH